MENILHYELNYRIKGEKLKRIINIDFVPNIRHKEARQIQELVFQVQAKWNNIKMLEQEIEDLKSDPEGKNTGMQLMLTWSRLNHSNQRLNKSEQME